MIVLFLRFLSSANLKIEQTIVTRERICCEVPLRLRVRNFLALQLTSFLVLERLPKTENTVLRVNNGAAKIQQRRKPIFFLKVDLHGWQLGKNFDLPFKILCEAPLTTTENLGNFALRDFFGFLKQSVVENKTALKHTVCCKCSSALRLN